MRKTILIVSILTSFLSSYAQDALTQKQIMRKNYEEVICPPTNDSVLFPDKYAMYPNGVKGIEKHIIKKLIYPLNALKNRIQGKVSLGFIVEKDGNISSIEVLESVDTDLDAEAIRVLKEMKKWVPGQKDGKPVRVAYVLPINFSLK